MLMSRITGFTFFVFALSLSLPSSFPVSSQQLYAQDNAKPMMQLHSFAKAYIEIEKIRQSYEPELSITQDPQRAKEIEHEAIVRIDNAIANEGLTVEAFTQIVEKANADATLRKQIDQLVEKEKNNS
jgi:hypothetical protein